MFKHQVTRTVADEALLRARGGPGSAVTNAFSSHVSYSASGTVSVENTLANVTTNAITLTIAAGVNQVTVKDRTGSMTPTIVVQAAGGVQIEDPNNLGTFGATAVQKSPAGAVTYRFDGTAYEVIATT